MADETKPTKAAPAPDLKLAVEEAPRKGTRRAQPGLAAQLGLGVQHQMPGIISGWRDSLELGELTDEMVDVFVALGWLSSRQDPRLSPKDPTKG